ELRRCAASARGCVLRRSETPRDRAVMNDAELVRNIWLELTARRTVQMVVVVGLILLTANATPFLNVAHVAQYLFYAIVVLWGTRDAAQAVVGEIRERTWDFQRLS